MYRALTIAFVFLCTALAWWALELQGKLVYKEKELFELRKARAAALEAEKRVQVENASLKENVERLRKERDAARGEAPEAVHNSPDSDGAIKGFIKPMETPEMKKMLRSQYWAETKKTYAKLLKRWNLSSEEADSVIGILTEREISDFLPSSSEHGYYQQNEKLKAVIGPERMKELEAFDKEQERELVVSRYADHLDITGSSLNPQQRTQLADLIRKENSGAGFGAFDVGDISEVAIAKSRRLREETQGRIIRDAAKFLSPDQVSGLQSAFREENEQTETSLKSILQSLGPMPVATEGNSSAPTAK
jgi:hypothetical protein